MAMNCLVGGGLNFFRFVSKNVITYLNKNGVDAVLDFDHMTISDENASR